MEPSWRSAIARATRAVPPAWEAVRPVDVGKIDIDRQLLVMSAAPHVGEFEQLVLLAILRQPSASAALDVLDELERRAARRVTRGTLYKTLDRLESKGLIDWTVEEAGPERGGHPRRLFRVTAAGVGVLRTTRSTLARMWDGLESVLEGRSG